LIITDPAQEKQPPKGIKRSRNRNAALFHVVEDRGCTRNGK
jgi:hypothetical protein